MDQLQNSRAAVFPAEVGESVIFLDVDGVLKPAICFDYYHHINEYPQILEQLTQKLNYDDSYEREKTNYVFEEALLTAVFVWQESAVNEVRRLSELNHAGIVLASDWRRGGAHWLKIIFGARGLWPPSAQRRNHGLSAHTPAGAPLCDH